MSTQPDPAFERRFPNQLAALSRVTQEAVQFLEAHGVGERPLYLANLAIEELGTNLLKYAYSDTAVHQILLRLELQPDALLLELEDDGLAFNPLEAPQPEVNRPAEQRAVGGLGLHLLRQLADQLHYQRSEGRNRLRVKIRLH